MIARARKYLDGSGLGPLLVKAVTGSAGLRIAGIGFGFLVGVQLARGLGAEGYGVYGLAMSIIALLTVPTEFGLPQLLTREVAAAQVRHDWSRLKGILRWSVRTSLFLSLLVTGAVLGWLMLFGQGLASPVGLTVLAGLIMVTLVALGNLNAAALRGLQHIVKGQLPDVLLRPALFSLLLFLVPLLFVPLSPVIAIMLGALSAMLAFSLAAILLRRFLPEEVRRVSVCIDDKLWWTSALPMALTEGMRVMQGHLVILLLGIMTTTVTVGVYRVASSTMLLIAMPIVLLNTVGAPIISRLYAEKDQRRLQQLLAWIAFVMMLGTTLLTLPFIFSGEVLLGKIFGDEFTKANPVLLILCLGMIINGIFGANAVLLNMTGYQVRVTRASGISLALLLISTPLMILGFDVVGAAVASMLSITVWNFLIWRDALRLLSLDSSVFTFLRSRMPN